MIDDALKRLRVSVSNQTQIINQERLGSKMAKQYFESDGWEYEVDFCSVIENGKIELSVRKYKDGWATGIWSTHHLKVGYRPERTWDDHMGNTPCGYYVNLPIGNGKHKRVYVY